MTEVYSFLNEPLARLSVERRLSFASGWMVSFES